MKFAQASLSCVSCLVAALREAFCKFPLPVAGFTCPIIAQSTMKGEFPVWGLEVAGSLTSKRFPTGSRFAALWAIIGRVNHPPFEGFSLLALLAARRRRGEALRFEAWFSERVARTRHQQDSVPVAVCRLLGFLLFSRLGGEAEVSRVRHPRCATVGVVLSATSDLVEAGQTERSGLSRRGR